MYQFIIGYFVKKIVKKKRIYFFFVFFFFFIYGYDFMEMWISMLIYQKILAENLFGLQVEFGILFIEGWDLCYLEIGWDFLFLVVFIYGVFSFFFFWWIFLKDMSFLVKVKLMVVDWLGYGYFGYGKFEILVKKQVVLIVEVIREKWGQYFLVILYGLSYGGIVVVCIVMDFLDFVDGILL